MNFHVILVLRLKYTMLTLINKNYVTEKNLKKRVFAYVYI